MLWYCAMCDQMVMVPIPRRLPLREHPMKAASRQLLAKVEDHIGFHTWQFGNEIDSWWLEEQDQGMDED
jgi:hypothetical protein